MLKHANKSHLDQVIQALYALKLEGMADALANQYEAPLNQDLSFLQRIELIIFSMVGQINLFSSL